jgi:branched-chain amino acid transport system ATP-binding protein
VAKNLQISQWLAAEQGRGQAADDAMEARIVALFPEVRTFLQRQGLYLSDGQKKRMAMALSPSVLLLAEAFKGLAPVVMQRFAKVVKQTT